MTTVAWFHCFAGIAGDMALGSCLDAGAPLDEVVAILERLPVSGWELEAELVMRGGLAGTKAHVRAKPDTITRTYGHIAGIIEEARLPDRVRERAQRVFRLLAETEGRLHRRPTASVHFHEVGGIDAIVDIVGTCAALETLGVDEVSASTVRVGTGMVRTAHGLLPNPSPAVVDLLKEAPVIGLDVNAELTTPTGAALLAGLCSGYGPLPPMRLTTSGFGAGTRELATLPNLLQVAIGEAASGTAGAGALSGRAGTATAADDDATGAAGDGATAFAGQPLALLEANLDDISGEVVAHAVDALLAAGALDAWTAHVSMKKGRPGVVLSTLAHLPDAPRLRDLIAHETGTLGVRVTTVDRWPFARQADEVEIEGLPVRIKRTALRVKVEYEDAARVARHTGLPLREVVSRAEAEARRTSVPPTTRPEVPTGDDGGTDSLTDSTAYDYGRTDAVTYEDILYDRDETGLVTITINRPDRLNAFRPQTVDELVHAFQSAWRDRGCGVVILTGAGEKAFCVGGDQLARGEGGGYGDTARSDVGIDIDDLHTIVRDIPKPVIAAVNGYAIGGGHVLHVLCDLTIAADTARFGQVGPKVGSVDPGFGTAYLARLVGQKKAREIWYLCRQYSAEEAREMGLVNTVVPKDRLMEEARAWAAEILQKSPTAIKLAKASFNADTENIRGIATLGMAGLALYYNTEESAEGTVAFQEKRAPEFGRFRK